MSILTLSSNDILSAAIARLAPVSLQALNAQASLLTRVDRKYVLSSADLALLLTRLEGSAQALEIGGRREFGYRSIYFDTPYLTSYLMAARKRPRRFKVRTREYLDSSTGWLEVKTRDRRGRTVKSRMPYPLRESLNPAGRVFIAEELAGCCPVEPTVISDLSAELSTEYRRSTLLLADQATRVTLDTSLLATDMLGRRLHLPGLAIVESKSTNGSSQMDRLLWGLGHRPIQISKFATSLAALHPVLPSNKWQPALRRLALDAQIER